MESWAAVGNRIHRTYGSGISLHNGGVCYLPISGTNACRSASMPIWR